jgi:hypothetical protein
MSSLQLPQSPGTPTAGLQKQMTTKPASPNAPIASNLPISKQILDEMIEAKVYEAETNLMVSL